MAQMGEYVTRQMASGKVIATGAMEPIQAGTVIAPVDGKARIVDGPYTEAKELIAGWVLLEADSRDEAIKGLGGVRPDAHRQLAGLERPRRRA